MNKIKCRLCGGDGKLVINLKNQPLANQILNHYLQKQKYYPLKIFRCKDCYLLQIYKNIDPKIMFNNYVWVTGTSKSTLNYLEKLSTFIQKKLRLRKSSKILEIASNDGTFLKILNKKFQIVLGIEPAKNLSRYANKKGNITFNYFFNLKAAKIIKQKIKTKFNLIIARNVMPHISNLHSVFLGVNTLLENNGRLLIEFHYVKNIFDKMQFDYIYHEHTYYFSIKTLSNYAAKYGLFPNDVKKSHISGGSLVVIFSKNKKKSSYLKKLINEENLCRINTLNKATNFQKSLNQYSEKLNLILNNKKYQPIAGFGSSARSNTLINFIGIKGKILETIFDNNTYKHNKYTPGQKKLILKPTTKNIKKFKTVIIFAWNFYKEIKKQLINLRFKGYVIKTLPKPKIEKI